MSIFADVKSGSLDPEIITALLRKFNWAPAETVPNLYQIWRNELLYNDEILLPTNPSKGDYEHLLARAYRALVSEHGADVVRISKILSLQSSSMLDATKWAKDSPYDAGLISWDQGESLFMAARSTLVAAAKATKEPRRYYGNAATHIAKSFLEKSYMGQTEMGSFVVTAYTPSDGIFYMSKTAENTAASKLMNFNTRSGGDIINTFDVILAGVRAKLDEFKKTPREEIFDDLLEFGFSYEMSSALASLTNSGDSAISISRSDVSSTQRAPEEYVFDAVESPILTRVALRFAAAPDPEVMTLVGEVTFLEHWSTLETRTVRLHVSNRPGIRVVRVRLDPEQYQIAIDAHRNDIPLRVVGTIEKDGRLFWMYDPSRVSIATGLSNDDQIVEDGDEDEISEDPALF